jgi:ATP-binding cassette subfamily F protein 3
MGLRVDWLLDEQRWVFLEVGMLTVHHLSKSFDSQTLFEDVTFSLNPGERVGLVGPNGCGKTTLLRILAGFEPPGAGQVERPNDLRIGYLPQGFELDPQIPVGELIGSQVGSAEALYRDLETTAARLVEHPEEPALQEHYDRLVSQIASAETGRAAQVLAGLGLDTVDPNLLCGSLSGGQKTRLALALVLLSDPQLLLLDEPTNHLDIAMLEWLETWLNGTPYATLIVSHDRVFLDRTVSRILELDPRRGFHEYPGNFSAYEAQRQTEIEKQWSAYQDQQAEIQRMKADVMRAKEQAAYTERQASSVRIGGSDMKIKGYKDHQRSIAKKVARKAKSRETKLERYIESDERVERPWENRSMRLEFRHTPHLGKHVIRLEELSVGYLPDKPLLQNLNLDIPAHRRIVLSGPNGSGKTTLLRTIVEEVPPLSGKVHLGPTAKIGFMSQDQSGLDGKLTALEIILPEFPNETQARAFLALYLLTGDETLKPVSLLSYGQRARLVLALLVARGCNLLLLDEPINHLDIPSRAQFENALSHFEGTVLAVVHDRYFIERFADEVWWVEAGGIRVAT